MINRRQFVGRSALAGAAAAGALAAGGRALRPAAAQDKTEITIYHIWGTPPGGTPAATPHPMTQVIDAFNAQSDTVTVNSVTPGNYYETLQKTQADIAAGNPPDLVSVPWAFIEYGIEGLGLNELPTVAGDRFAELQGLMSDTAWPLVTKDDKVYGFPWGLSTPILYYNADLFEQAGVDPATAFATWESFATEALKLQEALGGGAVLGLSYNKDWPAQTIIQCNGGRVMNDDGSFGITSDEARQAMQTIADLDTAGLYDRSGTNDEIRANFVAGTTAVMQASVASLGGLNADVQYTLGTNTWPQFGEKPVIASTGGSFLGSFTKDESKFPAVTEFLAFCGSEAGYTLWNKTGYVNISKLELEHLPGQEPAYAQFDAGLIRETNWPGARGSEAGNAWDQYVQRMWANDISVEEGTTEALAEIEEITG
ncbi:MAG TPA: extracellular solute-binding protein [Thermomicrobiales bacterium]|nr:extracellular solute-binding protein [Thermomicrobiales bacterium]